MVGERLTRFRSMICMEKSCKFVAPFHTVKMCDRLSSDWQAVFRFGQIRCSGSFRAIEKALT